MSEDVVISYDPSHGRPQKVPLVLGSPHVGSRKEPFKHVEAAGRFLPSSSRDLQKSGFTFWGPIQRVMG